VTSQQDLRDFLALNPDFGERRDPEASVREWEAMRSLGRRVFLDLLDENEEHPAQSRTDINRRAELAAWMIRERALRAQRLAEVERSVQPRTVERARAGAER